MNNILHVVNISFVIPFFLGKQLLYFAHNGYKEYIICSPSEELEDLSKVYEFEYRTIDILRKISIWNDLKAVFVTARYICHKHINIVTGHTPKGALIAMLAAYVMRVPIRIYFRHGLVYETSSGLKRKLLIIIDRLAAMLATKVVCVSPSVYQRSLEDRLNPVSKQTLLSKGTCNGIDVDRFCKQNIDEQYLVELKTKRQIKSSDFVIGFTGRLVKDKGIIDLIYAFQQLQYKYSHIVLLLVGMLEERDALPEGIIKIIKNNPRIINTGYVKNTEMGYYYAMMDLFVLPSYREGFPTSVLEASAMELPVVTTKVTGCIDSIIEEKTGVYVGHEPDSLSMAIERFYHDKRLCYEYGQSGRKFVVNNFEQHIIWREIEKLYLNA
ncbi:glycosyltransferase family 4 protein [Odoribacter lunatus]|uniref:glycosyltransferase family 4 protein n=1 Tax=Odoribacter lunatus TaxID=2941335 RepID=UPI0020413EC2|nr:glycosyltransferase family 4 protein [Odoribacter lunatus]